MQLSERYPDGSTLRQHLQAGADASRRPADARLSARPPAAGAWLWAAFGALGAGRSAGMSGGGAIPPSEIDAWQRLHGVRLTSWEVETIEAMDRAALATLATQRNRGVQ